MKTFFTIALLAIMASTANAQTVQRCVGPDGKVTFTQTGCGTELRPEQVYDASSPPPSGGRDVVPLASPERFPRPHPAPSGNPRDRVTVVGEKIDPCAKYIGKSPVGGWSMSGVRSQFGRPDRVRTYNGREDWVWYETSRRPYRSVDFDENGCATSLYESQSGRRR